MIRGLKLIYYYSNDDNCSGVDEDTYDKRKTIYNYGQISRKTFLKQNR